MPLDFCCPIRGLAASFIRAIVRNVAEFGCALEVSFTEDEVYGTLLGCSEDKARGLKVLKNNENGIMCKLDIEKAYDNVDWAMDGGFMLGCKVKGRNEKGSDFPLVAVSGLRINLEKSELIPVGRVENIDDLALKFDCRVGSLPSTYLGLPLGAPFKSISVWDGVEEHSVKDWPCGRDNTYPREGEQLNPKHFAESSYLLYVLVEITKFS
ncbi:hypothetical protein CK203_040202 [Vitis vinifera]|uniref:Reverse transcriptase domain-containing protein n=1 Tax=Vitis vinifera TaxID=29760 RepID=A0A438HXD0_VITVI|nr:hypothetical protein CK203_040202 [Vitis vinifera]